MASCGLIYALAVAGFAGQALAKNNAERWIALSRTAMAITGTISLSPTQLRTETASFPLKVVVDLPQFEGQLGIVPARVLAVTSPRNPVLLNSNRFCRRFVRWIVASHTKDGDLELDVFEGKRMPTSVKSAGNCGAYFYSRP